jgi:hypothetical protein
MNITDFKTMVHHHDLTHMYSDDGRVIRLGHASLMAIREAAKSLPTDMVREIWNFKVDQTLSPSARANFYWKD